MFLPAGTAQCRHDVFHRSAARALDQDSGVAGTFGANGVDQLSLSSEMTAIGAERLDRMCHVGTHCVQGVDLATRVVTHLTVAFLRPLPQFADIPKHQDGASGKAGEYINGRAHGGGICVVTVVDHPHTVRRDLRHGAALDRLHGSQAGGNAVQGQTNGMTVAQRNISDATALLQTSEGAFDEVSNIMYRMKDLATQAANDTNTQKDRDAINSELNDLNSELGNIMNNTSYAGDKLFGASGKFANALNFQIGSSTDETMSVDLSTELKGGTGALTNASGQFNKIQALATGASGLQLKSADDAKKLMTALEGSLDDVGSVRSKMGASINRLGHTAANLANMKDNTDLALSNIQDADYATEASTMSRNQLLAQTSMSMLKQSNSMSSMVMSLLG